MSPHYSTSSPAQHIIFRTDAKPLRFAGVLLGARTILDEENGESDTRVRLFRTERGALFGHGIGSNIVTTIRSRKTFSDPTRS
jgi:hypothetical protein